jgi:hypothetical protein
MKAFETKLQDYVYDRNFMEKTMLMGKVKRQV